jgi:hypothetical protein
MIMAKGFLVSGFLLSVVSLSIMAGDKSCESDTPVSSSGISPTSVRVPVDHDGLTTEQRNVRDRLLMDNKPGSIKHLYVISAYSGQVILYSTVRGKVTSSGKRLAPRSADTYQSSGAFPIHTPGGMYYTNEVIEDDGTWGDSIGYLYWWDVQGRYHQHYVTGGQIVHISDQPIPVKSITINVDAKAQ